MRSASVIKFERNVDRAASALFALACAFASYLWLARDLAQPVLGVEAAASAALAYLLSHRLLSAIQPRPRRLPVPIFDLRKIDPDEPAELLLTERYAPPVDPASEPLVLDDILAELGPDSRVVRLFDPASMPTAGQLNQRIERHLDKDVPPATPADAAQALHDALAELRRSLR
jgi:hypothetical protein